MLLIKLMDFKYSLQGVNDIYEEKQENLQMQLIYRVVKKANHILADGLFGKKKPGTVAEAFRKLAPFISDKAEV